MKYLITMPALTASLFFMYCLKAGAASAYPVDTEIMGMTLRTSVDSILAQVLLQAPDSGATGTDATIEALLSRCRSIPELPSPEDLAWIAREHTIDTATALLIHCLEQLPGVRETQSLFQSELGKRRRNDPEQLNFLAQHADHYKILFIPGWGYQSNGEVTGSNLRIPREIISALGFETHLVEIPDFGSVEGNAQYLADSLRQHLKGEKKVLLASASSGGSAVALALTESDIFNHPDLAGWLNICGVLRGSPVIDRFLDWPRSLLLRLWSFFQGWNHEELLSLSRRYSAGRFGRFRPPPHLAVLNYVGVPFSAQVSNSGKTPFRLLRSLGPNDGLTLITDALAPGHTVIALGSDHFIREDPEIDLKTVALLPVLLHLIED